MTNTDIAPRLGVSYDLTGQGRTVLKAFYGRYYNNLADGFSSANPGGTNYAEYNFNDRQPQRPLRRAARAGRRAASHWRRDRRRSIRTSTRRIPTRSVGRSSISSGVNRRPGSPTSAKCSASSCRSITRRSCLPGSDSSTVPIRVVTDESGEVFNLVDIPASLADQSDARFDNIPDGDFNYDTIEFAFNKRFGSQFFAQSSFDYQWRDELRSPDIDNWGTTSPLNTDPIGVNYFLNPNPAVANRQETTGYGFAMMGRYVFPRDFGVRRQLSVPERLPVFAHHS